MIMLLISHTSRRAGPGGKWRYTRDTRAYFQTKVEAWRWCRENLGKRHARMFIDKKDGTTVKTGRVYSAREWEDGRWYYMQYWVKAFEVSEAT